MAITQRKKRTKQYSDEMYNIFHGSFSFYVITVDNAERDNFNSFLFSSWSQHSTTASAIELSSKFDAFQIDPYMLYKETKRLRRVE